MPAYRPTIVLALLAVFGVVHLVRSLLLEPEADIDFLLMFAFIPVRYDSSLLLSGTLPGGWAANVWTFVTYAFIHADVTHLGVNSIWFLAFGSALARRFAPLRFLAFFVVTAAAGAAVHSAPASAVAPISLSANMIRVS